MRRLAVMVCLVIACDQGEKPAPKPPPPPQEPKVVGPRDPTKNGTSTNLFDYVPKEADGVVYLDVSALRLTKAWMGERDLLVGLLSPELTKGERSEDSIGEPPGKASNIVIALLLESGRALVIVESLASDKPVVLQRELPVSGKELRDIVAKRTGLHVERITGNATVAQRVDLDVELTLGSLVEATNFATLVQSQRQSPQIKQMFDRFDVVARGNAVTFTIGMTDAQLAAVLPQLRALVGAP